MGMPPAPPRELSRSSSIVKEVNEEDQLLHFVKQENADDLFDASSSPSLDPNNDDASFVQEMTEEEEEQLCEAKRIDELMRLASDPMTRFNKVDEVLIQTQLYVGFIREKIQLYAGSIREKMLELSSNHTSGYDSTLTEEEM
jgi:ATP-dependent DNA helicase